MMTGREEEQSRLRKAYESEHSEFVVVYGRRRVGKTFLVRESFNYKFTFQHTGLAGKSTRQQLHSFQLSLRSQGFGRAPLPANWLEAFDMLAGLVSLSRAKKKVVFIDEMPWMDAPKSSFLPALEQFWNGFASARKDVLLIVCGSATSWITRKLLRNRQGLHNRVTCRIHLQPFTLHECECYARQQRLGMSRHQLMEGYMALGGIPYYWSLLDREKSLALNIDRLFFSRGGELRGEYAELYASLFHHPEKYLAVIEALGRRKAGLSRAEIVRESGLPENGKLTEVLDDLESCGFIRKYGHIGMKAKNALFQLTDCYTLFYFQFIDGNTVNDEHFWSKSIDTGAYNSWCGLAFERVCLLHSRQIKTRLGVAGVISSEYAWWAAGEDGKRGAQADLLIDRSDGVINLCEMKFTKTPYKISAADDAAMRNRQACFVEDTRTRKAVHLTLVSAQGVERNAYSDEVQAIIVGDDLFTE